MSGWDQPAQNNAEAFQDAVARARQIAAKINVAQGQPAGGDTGGGIKRSWDSTGDAGWNSSSDQAGSGAKKLATGEDAIATQLRAIAEQQRTQAAQAAQEAAARINQSLGISGGVQQQPQQPPQMGGGGGQTGMGYTEDYSIPDKLVGLVIGKGGEQITRIQAESGCKVQIAPDSGGMPDRSVTLSGSQDSIMSAKMMINEIVSKGKGVGGGGGGFDNGGGSVVEILIPGGKVGLIIGKGGETIKQLQERAGVKMVMIQDSNVPTHVDKPLRISGAPDMCQRAKEMVMDLLVEKELESMNKPGGGGGGGFGNWTNDYGGGQKAVQDLEVPRPCVGVIIGKGGDMIKSIQNECGVKLQFTPDDGMTENRKCQLSGSPDGLQRASDKIRELIEESNKRGQDFGRGRGRGRGRDDRGSRFEDRHGGPGRGFGDHSDHGGYDRDGGGGEEARYTVPADKCGLVIGRGGETIRDIKMQTGAYVELSKQPAANPAEKIFVIRGEPGQIQHAMQLIGEKVGQGPDGGGPGGPGGPGGYGGGGYGQPNQQQPQQGFAPQGWGNAQYGQWQQGAQQQPQQPDAAVNPQTGQPDYSAAWAEYYRQQGMHYHADAILAQARQQQAGGQAPPPQQPQPPAQQQQQQQYGQPYGQYGQQ